MKINHRAKTLGLGGLLLGGALSTLALPISFVVFSDRVPTNLGPHATKTMWEDGRPSGTQVEGVPAPWGIGFDRPLALLGVGNGWETWGIELVQSVYYTRTSELLLTLPPDTLGFGFSIQPNLWDQFDFQIAALGETYQLSAHGEDGAWFVGFWSTDRRTPIPQVRIWDMTGASDGFAIGHLTLAARQTVPAVPDQGMSLVMLALALVPLGFAHRRSVPCRSQC